MLSVLESSNTLSLLRNLASSKEAHFADDFLLSAFQTALQTDGYSVTRPHYLRGLSEEEHDNSQESVAFFVIMIFVCLMCAGFASGLTQGLLSLDYMEMTIKSRSGTEDEKLQAARVMPVIKNHHLLLVTLMLWNACAMEALPIFLDRLVPSYLAVIISVTGILFVGEIIPASILTGPNQLRLASSLIPLVRVVIAFFFPISYPIAKLLDYIIGDDGGVTVFNKTELNTMMAFQHKEGIRMSEMKDDPSNPIPLHKRVDPSELMHFEEVSIIGGALRFRKLLVGSVMTVIDKVFMVSAKDTLDAKTMLAVFKSGYSRIPVYDRDRNDIIGLILAKDLIFVDVREAIPVRDFIELFGRKPAVVWQDNQLGETFGLFREAHSQMAIVRDAVSKGETDVTNSVVGIITLEDIVGEILQTHIGDESDGQKELLTRDSLLRDLDFENLHEKLRELNTRRENGLLNGGSGGASHSRFATAVVTDGHMNGHYNGTAAAVVEGIEMKSVCENASSGKYSPPLRTAVEVDDQKKQKSQQQKNPLHEKLLG